MTTPEDLAAREGWDAAASGYAEHVAPRLMEGYADAFVDRLDVGPQTEALEVAAGSGALTATLGTRVRSLLATDLSPQMIDGLRERVRASGLSNVTCEVMNGQALDLRDASFDRAISSFGVMLFPDRAKGLSELRRVLRSDGRAVVTAWSGPETFELFALFLGAMKRAFPDMPPPPEPPPVFSLADPAKFRDEMEAAGFRNVEVDTVSRRLVNENVGEVWTMLTSGAPPVQALFDRVGPEGKNKLHDAVATVVAERFGDGPIETTNVANVATGLS